MTDPSKFQTIYRGRVHVLGNNIDTDQIMPGKYLTVLDPKELAKHCLEGYDPDWATKKAKAGDIIIAGHNFGCGSSRESAPVSIKAVGIAAVVAESFARIFFRNSVATGELYPCECTGRLCEVLKTGDVATVDLDKCTVTVNATGKVYSFKPLGDVRPVVDAGGLFNYARKTGMIPAAK